jgi:two-component system, sensor histidine kinase
MITANNLDSGEWKLSLMAEQPTPNPAPMPQVASGHLAELALIRRLYDGRYPVGLATVAAGLLLWGFLYWQLHDWHVILWGAVQHLGVFVMLAWYRSFARQQSAPGRFRVLMWQLHGIHIASGLTWGAVPWLFVPPDNIDLTMLVVMILTGVTSGGVAYLAMIRYGILSFATPIAICLTFAILRRIDEMHVMLAGFVLLHFAITAKLAMQQHATMVRSITTSFEKETLADQLQHEKELAERANTAKSKFLAAASHDLRQPIHAQGLFLEVLSRTDLSDYQRTLLKSARAASEASGELLNALLDFSRIEAGVVDPLLQPFRLQLLFNKVEKELAPLADAKDIVYRSRDTQLIVQTDPVLLELILRNLISNAIRYTDHGGVLVASRRRRGQAIIEVWDTGIGIAPEHQQDVFQEFHQLGNPERDRRKGLGLGLAIAAGLAKAMKHELSVSSVPGRGSVFRLTLPVISAVPVEQQAMVQSKTRVLNARLLVIEDDEIVRDGMCHLLRGWGSECDAAESIEEALALVQLNVPDVIISDYRLREQRTGVEAIEAVREKLGSAIPALLITGDTAPTRLREAQASGIPLLHKPVSPDKLYRRLVELRSGPVSR